MKRLTAAIGLLGMLVGVPVLLLRIAGPPAIPSFEGVHLNDTYMPIEPVLQVVALLGWIVWSYVTFVTLMRAIAIISQPSRTLTSFSSAAMPAALRTWVDLAIGGAFIAAALNPRIDARLEAVAHRSVAVAPERAPARTLAPHRAPRMYTVKSGDSLWRIAERELGSGFRWHEIFELNDGKRFGAGERFRDARLIRPGWVLELPNGKPAEVVTVHARPGAAPPVRPAMQARRTPPRVECRPYAPARSARPAVELPSGAIIASSFASGLLTAALLVRLRRRRAFRPLQDPATAPEESSLLRELRVTLPPNDSSIMVPALDALASTWRRKHDSLPNLVAVTEHRRHVVALIASKDEPPPDFGGSISPHVSFRALDGVVETEITGPFPPGPDPDDSLARSLVPLSRGSDGSVLHVAPFGLGCLSVSGASAAGIARQAVIALATASPPDDLQLVLIGAHESLPELVGLPHVSRVATWSEADVLQEAQAEFLHRARLLFESDEPDARSLNARQTGGIPNMLIVTTSPPEAYRGVVEAIAVEGARLGAALMALDWEPATTALRIHASDKFKLSCDVVQTPAGHEPLTLDASRAADAIALLRDAHPVIEDERADESADASILDAGHVPAPMPEIVTVTPPAAPRDGTPRAEIRCLGTLVVHRPDGSTPNKGWRSAAKELLAFLVVHPDGAHKERIADVLFPEQPPRKAADLIARAASVIRTQVRRSSDELKFVELDGETWRLEPGAWRVDAWEFERVIADARSCESHERIPMLRQALGLYRGEFCDDAYFAWAQPVRERYRSLYLRASADLAERLVEAGASEDALESLDRAIEAEPLCEDLYRRAMTVEASLGRARDALDRYRRLSAVLETELEGRPAPETEQLARDIERRSSASPHEIVAAGRDR